MGSGNEGEALRALEIGSVRDASAAIGRLLAVTEAAMNRRAQLETALQTRVAIEQAKGVIAERYGMDVEAAFALLRRAARTNRVKLHDLVRRVRPGEPDPPELAQALAEQSASDGVSIVEKQSPAAEVVEELDPRKEDAP